MARYYFHILDGRTVMDDVGSELPTFEAARREAVMVAHEVVLSADGSNRSIWLGETAYLWVTDGPGGTGKTIFTIRISASENDEPPLLAA